MGRRDFLTGSAALMACAVVQASEAIVGSRRALPEDREVSAWRAVANRGALPWKQSGRFGTEVEHVSYSHHTLGGSDVSEMRLVYSGVFDDARGETADATCTIESSLYFPSAPGAKVVKFTFDGGKTIGNLIGGAPEYLTDSLFPAQFGWSRLPRRTDFYITTQRKFFQSNAIFSYNALSKFRGDGGSQYIGIGNFVDKTMAMGIGVSGNSPYLYLPAAIIGRNASPEIAVLGLGDSLEESLNQANSSLGGGEGGYNNIGGWFARGMTGVSNAGINGRIIPWTNTAVQASSSQAMLAHTSARAALMKYFTHVVCNYFHNGDLIEANEFARLRQVWALCRSAPNSKVRHIEQVLGLPQASSSDGFTSYANQTPDRTFAPNGTSYRDILIAAITASVGSNGLDAIYSHNNIMEGRPGRWIIGTIANQYVQSDGTHATSAGHDLMTPQFQARTATWN